MSTPLASFFTKIGFEVDPSALKKVENTFDRLQKQAQSMAKALQTPTQRMQERLNVAAMRQQVLMQEKKNQGILNQITESKNLVRQRERENKLDDVSRRHSMFMEKSLERRQQIVAKTAELSERARMKATPYAQRTGMGSGGSSPSGGIGGNVSLTRGDVGGFLGAYLGLDLAKKAVGHSFNMGNFQVSQPAQYKFLTGSEEGAQEQIKYVNGLVDKLKLNLVETNQAYVQFLGATVSTIGADKTQQIFENLQSFGVMMGATGDQLKRGTKAVSQMLSKQKLSAEELTGQMAEANLIPGATQVFADVLEGDGTVGGGDVKKLFKNMELGKYTLQDIVKVMEQLQKRLDQEALQKMLTRPTAELTELHTATQRFFEELNNQGATDLMRKFLDFLTDSVKWLTKNLPHIVSLIKDIWVILKPMLTLWVTMWGVGKLVKFAGVLKSLRGGIKGLKGDSDNLATTMFMVGAALWRIGKFFKKSFVAVGILALIDMLETLQGKRTVLTQLMQDGGVLGGIATTLVSIFRTAQVAVEIIIAALHALFTNDWSMFSGFVEDSISRWRDSMNSLFPFDKWFANFVELGKLVLGVMNPVTAIGAISEYSRFKEASASWNQQSAMKSPTLLARSNPYTSSGGYMAPAPTTINFNPSITINGSGLSQAQLESTVTNVLDKQMTKAKANYVMAR